MSYSVLMRHTGQETAHILKKAYARIREVLTDPMKKKCTEGPSRKEAIIDSLSLPKDVLLGAIKVTLTGSQEAWIENYKGILEYTECQILLQGKNCQVCFEGQRLCIEYYTNEDMKISGCIRCVRYQ